MHAEEVFFCNEKKKNNKAFNDPHPWFSKAA